MGRVYWQTTVDVQRQGARQASSRDPSQNGSGQWRESCNTDGEFGSAQHLTFPTTSLWL